MTDLISRQAAIDAILHNQEVYSNNFGNDPIDRYTVAIIDNDAQTIAQLPTIEAEPVKHGRWEFEAKWQYKNCDGRGMERKEIFGTTKRTCNRLKCSKCKKVVVIDDTIAYAYCPHCGAKMDAEEAETKDEP